MKKIWNSVCYGCSACYSVCPKSAIEMREDEKGFLYPQVIEKRCIDCNLCKKVCESKSETNTILKVYIARLKDRELLKESQSGGAFTAIAEEILNQDGIIYGAGLDENFEAVHIRVKTAKQLDLLKKSKYIQSRMENVYQQVKEDLKNDSLVLFSGTPCQVDGLYKFLKITNVSTDNLLTVDLICHGVPSVKLWRDILKYYKKKYNQDVVSVIFRDKSVAGWNEHIAKINLENNSVCDDLHRQLFYNNLALRDSCYKCSYTSTKRVSDFTVGDAWGLKEKNPEFYNTEGASLILVNTAKAGKIIEVIKDKMQIKNVLLDDYMQGNLQHPTHANRDVDEFWKDYNSRSFGYIIKKYAKNNIFLNVKYIIKKAGKKIRGK